MQHALARIQMGLSARQFISEFRALRATVIRLWQRDTVEIDKASLNDMIRFNEAIDQVLGEGAITYTEEVETDSSSIGLGLYICKQIVAAHKGTIDVRSSADEGTTFIVRLPNA